MPSFKISKALEQKVGIKVSSRVILGNSTVRDLAKILQELCNQTEVIKTGLSKDELLGTHPVTSNQEQMLRLHALNPDSSNYNMPMAWWVSSTKQKKSLSVHDSNYIDFKTLNRINLPLGYVDASVGN